MNFLCCFGPPGEADTLELEIRPRAACDVFVLWLLLLPHSGFATPCLEVCVFFFLTSAT